MRRSLERINTPPDLISLILYLHQEMVLVFTSGELQTELLTGSGIRQGCGLAPLLWAAFSLTVLEQLQTYLAKDQITSYADDMHVAWQIASPAQFRQACIHIGKILDDLKSFGMQVAHDKTVILMHLGGSAYTSTTKGRIQHTKEGRKLIVSTHSGRVLLLIKKEHTYLGAKIRYGHFARATVTYRITQSWAAFNRLHRVLVSKALPLSVRLRLWAACVKTVLLYGLSY